MNGFNIEPLLGQIQISEAAAYAKRCAKMSTLRNALKIRKQGILGKVTFYEIPGIFLVNFQYLRKSMKQELLEMVQVTVSNFYMHISTCIFCMIFL